MQGIILASHGRLADGMLDTIKIFSDSPLQIETLCLMPEEDIAEFSNKLEASVDSVNTGDGVVIFCDLLFGTPCNCSAKLLNDTKYENQITIITGMNLPMVLEFVGSREFSKMQTGLIDIGRKGIVDFNLLLEETKGKNAK